MKVAIAYLTKDRVELTKQTFPALRDGQHALYWFDGSSDAEALAYFAKYEVLATCVFPNIKGGADAAIVFALTKMLASPVDYEVVGLCENDVLLHDGWFEKTIALFGKGADDGLEVGAVSPRAYVDRVLIQRDGWAVMHNLGAGVVLFTRKAAQLVLANYRNGWWTDNRAIFAQLSDLDVGRYAAFRGNEQWTTADWHFDAILAQHGLASLAFTPCAVDMIGQDPPLKDQGLELVRAETDRRDDLAFARFAARTEAIRIGVWRPETVKPIWHHHGYHIYFAHQLPDAERMGDWRLIWSQGFGPFAYVANEQGCQITAMVFGPVTFMVAGGKTGAKVTIKDLNSGYEISPELPVGEKQIAQLQVPGGMTYRQLILTCAKGAVFYGIQTVEAQPTTDQKFDFHSLPPV